jgi:hypothetical protein
VKVTGKSFMGVRWFDLGLIEINVARRYFAIALGPSAAALWFMVVRDPYATGKSPRRPRFEWVRSSS